MAASRRRVEADHPGCVQFRCVAPGTSTSISRQHDRRGRAYVGVFLPQSHLPFDLRPNSVFQLVAVAKVLQ